jgi:hypothetical protein
MGFSDLSPENTIADPDTGVEANVVTDEFGASRLLVDANVNTDVIGNRFILNLLNVASADMDVDGSTTPVVFELPLDVNDRIVRIVSFYGRDNGIQYNAFMARATLPNGVGVEIKSNDEVFTLPTIRTTDDFADKFSFLPGNFSIDRGAGDDKFNSAVDLKEPFIIKGSGSFTTPDYIKVTINDDLTAVNYLQCIVVGSVL